MTPDEKRAAKREYHRAYYAEHREKWVALAQERKGDPEHRERKRLADHRWYVANRDHHSASGKAWRDANLDRSRECARAAALARYWADPEKARAKGRADMKAAYARGRRQRVDPEVAWAGWLKWRFGITPEQWRTFYDEQGGACGICKGPQQGGQRLGVDHNHDTGLARGLLCHRCNLIVGKVETGQPVKADRAVIEAWIARPGIGTGSKYVSPPGRWKP
jgi:hypothetical protein